MSGQNKVSVFLAGVQKAGTTSMFAHLSEHGELSAPDRKETHFFDDEDRDWNAPDYRGLHDRYPATEGMRFDATPIYLFWPRSLERIRAYNPHAKLIGLFRDPIERAWSQWCMQYAKGSEKLTFSSAIREGRERSARQDDSSSALRYYSYVERGFYARQVARALDLFPSENILWLRSQDFRDKHRCVLASVSAFLGVGPFPDTGPRRDHSRAEIAYPSVLASGDIEYLAEMFHDDVVAFGKLTGLPVDDWLTMRVARGGSSRARAHWASRERAEAEPLPTGLERETDFA